MTAAAHPEYRVDIQLLRALAIALVLWFHARLPGLPGGFLGVDVFFVVSGYLMTGIIARELDEKRFSFAGFYARRIRRLLPAAYATLTVTACLSAWLLDAVEFRAFLAQLAGSFGFVANVVLWRQADYFNTAAAAKPLLHMWSLAIEEQYYLVLPALLVVCPPRWRLPANAVAVVASFASCLLMVDRGPSAAFYLLPFRAWELGLGSLTALLVWRGLAMPRRMAAVRAGAGLAIVIVALSCDEGHHPGWAALAVCLATAMLLLPGLDLSRHRWLRPAVALGDRSYSLYLVHWPLLALANNILLFAPPPWLNAALVAVALVWTEVQYRCVEQPLRRMRVNRRALAVLTLIPVVVLAACAGWVRLSDQQAPNARAENQGLASNCDVWGAFDLASSCRTGPDPTLLLWGDSHAMHLARGIAASAHAPMAQATHILCGPLLGLAPINETGEPRRWAERCLLFNDSVLAAASKAPGIQTVVLSTAVAQYVPDAEPGARMLTRSAGGTVVRSQDPALFIAALARTVAALHRVGKRVVLVAPPPAPGYDIGRCHDRTAQGKPIAPRVTSCDFSEARYRLYRAPELALLADVEHRKIVPVFRFDRALCTGGMCRTTLNGTLLYRDSNHLSVAGSALLGRLLDLANRLEAAAR